MLTSKSVQNATSFLFKDSEEITRECLKRQHKLLRNCEICDVVLVVNNADNKSMSDSNSVELTETEMPESDVRCLAHRSILSARSPYFHALFTTAMKESHQKEVVLHELDPHSLALLIDYMYICELQITTGNVEGVLQAASLFQLTQICDACCDFLNAQLHVSNCLGIRAYAALYGNEKLQKIADKFVDDHFDQVIAQSEEFLQLPAPEIERLISRDVESSSESKIYEAVIQWVKHDVIDRKQHLFALLNQVRLPMLPRSYLTTKVQTEPLIQQNPDCLRLVESIL